jgi:hypothetical protein
MINKILCLGTGKVGTFIGILPLISNKCTTVLIQKKNCILVGS